MRLPASFLLCTCAAALAAVAVAACTLDRAGSAPEPGAGASGGGAPTGGQGGVLFTGGSGGGGAASPCTTPDECGVDDDCQTPTCAAGHCGLIFEQQGTACTDQGGEVCDGVGHCRLDLGSGCGSATECASNFCVDAVCCEDVCSGACLTCALPGSEGSCLPALPATNPDGECGADVCDGAGACARGDLLWSHAWGDAGNDDDQAIAVAVDSQNNVVVAGSYEGTITLGGTTYTATAADFFVVKFDAQGNVVWTKTYAAAGDQAVNGVVVGTGNAIYITGTFTGALAMGGGPVASAGGRDVFVAKLDAQGNVLWANPYGDAQDQFGWAIARDGSDNVYVAGSFSGQIAIGGPPLAAAGEDAFVASLTPSGMARWGTAVTGSGAGRGFGVAVDDAGRTMLVGEFGGAIDFGPGGTATANGTDAYAVILDATGTITFAAPFGGSGVQAAYAVAAASDGFVAVGRFETAVDFGAGGPPALASTGGSDGFVVKLSAVGGELWSRALGSSAYDDLYHVAVDASDNVILGGEADGDITFAGATLPAHGGADALLVKLAADGTSLWGRNIGGAGDQYASAVGVAPSGRIAVVGPFAGTIDQGIGPHTSGGGLDAFAGVYGP